MWIDNIQELDCLDLEMKIRKQKRYNRWAASAHRRRSRRQGIVLSK